MKGWYLDRTTGLLSLRHDLPCPGALDGVDCRDGRNDGDELRADMAVVRVRMAGICATDLQIIRGYKGRFCGCIGHEFVGEVVLLPAETNNLVVGQRVVGEINIPCKAKGCEVCHGPDRIAARNHCPNRACLGIWQHSGAFAEFITLPIDNLFSVDATVADDMAVFTEPVAAACRVLEQLDHLIALPGVTQQAQRIAVIGDGKLGLLITAVLLCKTHDNVDICLIGKHKDNMDLIPSLKSGREVRKVLVSEGQGLPSSLDEGTFDVVVEATSSDSGFSAATLLVKPLGTVVLKSTCATYSPTTLAAAAERIEDQNEARNRVVVKEINVQGSRCGPFNMAVELIKNSEYMHALLKSLHDSTFAFDQMDIALERAGTRGVLKVLVQVKDP